MKPTIFDLLICSALAIVAMLLVLFVPAIGAARMLIGLPLVLCAPGYAIVAAAFPSSRLGTIERLLFSLGASLAVAALSGLLLHWTALGLRPASWAITLGNLTLVACLAALIRRWQTLRALSRPSPDHEIDTSLRGPSWPFVARGVGMTLAQGGMLGMAALLMAGAILIARDGAIQQRAAGFTQLWVLPDSAAQQESVRLGVSNREQAPIGYRLLVTASGTIIGSWPRITLGPNEQWEATVALPTAQPTAATVEAVLYRIDAPETAYRRVLFRRDSAVKGN